jgi:hypothetical protein
MLRKPRVMLFAASLSALFLTLALVAPSSSAAGSVSTTRGEHSHGIRASFGMDVAPLVAKRPLPGGGTVYIYDVAGLKVRSPIPPAGFDPVTASAAKLAEYGFPPRPAGGQALRTWLTVLRKAHPATPPGHLMVGHPAERLSAAPAVTVEDNPIWAGNMATSETYTNVYAYWLEPSIAKADCPTDYQMESTWAGLGGWHSDILVQAGTQYGEGQLYGSGLSNHQAWYELIDTATGTDDFVPIDVTATVGGEMYVNIYRASSSTYNIYVENEYTGQYWPSGTGLKFKPYDGSHAEFIVEDPYGGVDSGVYLIRFGTFEVQDAEASINDSTFKGLANWSHDDDIMVSPTTGHTMAYAGSAFNSGDSWDDYHQNCQ